MRKRPLTAAFVARVKTPGRYGDGGRGGLGLYLRVHRMKSGRVSKSWGQRVRVGGKPTNLGLGSYPIVTLKEAREKALENRRAVHRGHDPRDGGVPTFEAAVEKVIEIHSPTWKNPSRISGQWRQTLRDYAHPRIGRKRVSDVTTADVLAILKPIWSRKAATARAVRQRIGAVMKWAVAKGYRPDNPAGDAIAAALPRHGNATNHFRALPHGEVSAALVKVRNSGAYAGGKLAFEFMVLTAARSNEVRGATWDEIEHDVWTIPASRMKGNREHRVPLSRRALEILEEARKLHDKGGIVFRGARGRGVDSSMFGSMLRRLGVEGTPHGMRSSFRDWCSETGVAREVAEAALAHAVKNKVEAAYARSDLLERRRRLMEDWAAYLAGGGLRAARPELTRDRARRPFPGIPGAFRVIYGPWDRLRATIAGPRGVRVGWKPGRAGERRRRQGVTGRLFALAVGEAGGKEAGELARDGPANAFSGGARGGVFAGIRGLA